MTISQLRSIVKSKFSIGQELTLKTSDDAKAARKIKVKIVKFYPDFVATERNGCAECYRYWDILHMTRGDAIDKRGTKSAPLD